MTPRFLLLLAFSAALSAQTIEIEGDVVDSTTGAPVAGAYVVGRWSGPQPSVASSDSAGHFRFPDRTPWWGGIQVYRAGYVTTSGMRPGRIALMPEAVIFGKILDEDGFPGEGVIVEALRFRVYGGRRRLEGTGSFAKTNDLGEYRIAGMPAGRYYLRAVPRQGGWDRRYVPEFYPDTLDLQEASVIKVKAGEERGVNIQLTRHEGVGVAGQVLMPAGVVPSTGAPLSVSLSTPEFFSTSFFSVASHDGSFFFPHVPPGSYVVRVSSGNNPLRGGDLFAEQPVQVAVSDVRGIVLSPRIVEAVDLPGTVTFEGGAGPRPITVGLHGANGMPQSARSNDDGSFVLKGLVPGHYALQWAGEWSQQTAAASPIVFNSARLGDKEFSQWEGFDFDGSSAGPLRITFSAGSTVKGEILDTGGLPAPNVPVSFIPAGGSGPFGAMSNADGTFTASPLLPGDYRVYVLPDMDLAQDPDYLKAHENDFPPLHVVAGANPPLTLRVPATQQ